MTLPPVTLTCRTIQTARVQHVRIAHNSLAVALLGSRNAPVVRVPAQVPNGRVGAETRGGWELERLQALTDRLHRLQARQAITLPGTPERAALDASLDRAEGYVREAQVAVDAIDTTPRRPAGLRDVYTVTVPALHVRVEGVAYTADQWRGQVTVDPETPDYARYLGRGEWPGHGGTGRWPLWRPYSGGMKQASEAQDWHVVLLAQLWAIPHLPELLAVPMGVPTLD